MKHLFTLLVLAALAAFFLPSASATTYTLTTTPDSALAFGGSVTYIATYPQDARQKIGQRVPYNPVVQTDCSQNGVHVWTGTIEVQNEKKNADGSWTGTFYPITLGYQSSTWDTAQPADCSAVLVYWTKDNTGNITLNEAGSFYFTAAP